MNRGFATFAAFCVALILNASQATRGAPPQEVLATIRIDPQLGAAVPLEARFQTHTDEAASLGSLLSGRPVVLCLVYFRCPMLCKLAADGLLRSLGEIKQDVGREFDVWLISFDPRDDAAAAAAALESAVRRYHRSQGDKGWRCLTGESEAIKQLTDAVGFRYRWDDATQQYAHPAGLILLTPDGTISRYLDGVNYSPRELSQAIDSAAASTVATQAPTTFLRCYLYDSTTGRFGAAVQWTVRALGVLTVVVMIVGISRMIRRDQLQRSRSEQSA